MKNKSKYNQVNLLPPGKLLVKKFCFGVQNGSQNRNCYSYSTKTAEKVGTGMYFFVGMDALHRVMECTDSDNRLRSNASLGVGAQ